MEVGERRDLLSPWGVVVLLIVLSLPLLLPHFQQSPPPGCRSRALCRIGILRNGTNCCFSAARNRNGNGNGEIVKRIRNEWEVMMGTGCRRGWKRERERTRQRRTYGIHCFRNGIGDFSKPSGKDSGRFGSQQIWDFFNTSSINSQFYPFQYNNLLRYLLRHRRRLTTPVFTRSLWGPQHIWYLMKNAITGEQPYKPI